MKKKLALLLSAVMVASMVPMTAFAKTTNHVDKIVTGKADEAEYNTANAPLLTIQKDDLNQLGNTGVVEFELSLTNAEWETTTEDVSDIEAAIEATTGTKNLGTVTAEVNKLTATLISVKVTAGTVAAGDKAIIIPLITTLKGDGDANVTINPLQSIVSSGTYKFANVAAGATTATIEKLTDIQESGTTIKPIIIREATAGSMETGTFKLKLQNGFEFKNPGAITDSIDPSADGSLGTFAYENINDKSVVVATFTKGTNTAPLRIILDSIVVMFDEDDVDTGDIAEITISGAGMTKSTIEVGTARTYGVSITAENKTLPTFVAGRLNLEDETLKVIFKETITSSWLYNRKTTISFPAGVKAVVEDVKIKDGSFASYSVVAGDHDLKSDRTVITLPTTAPVSGKKANLEFKFNVSVDPGFTGDIVATFGGAGLDEDVEVVLGTVVAPVTVEAETNKVMIDYRNVSIGDIIIKETAAGNLKTGTTLYLEIDEMKFDGTPKVEVVEGDIKIDKVNVPSGGLLEIKIKTASSKTPAVLKVTGNELYLGRNLPAGSYALSIVAGDVKDAYNSTQATVNGETYDQADVQDDAIFRNYAKSPKGSLAFDTDEIVVLKNFVEVVTAGRDQDDSTFTTQLSVAIGADKLIVGDKEIALDVPAYISEGYTMLPVRAITEALSGTAIVRWDDATKTVTLTFGTRVVSMTVGSKTMNINGVAVQMSKACEITDSRAFIPLRDLGYALGLNDSKINWDDETKTATLN